MSWLFFSNFFPSKAWSSILCYYMKIFLIAKLFILLKLLILPRKLHLDGLVYFLIISFMLMMIKIFLINRLKHILFLFFLQYFSKSLHPFHPISFRSPWISVAIAILTFSRFFSLFRLLPPFSSSSAPF